MQNDPKLKITSNITKLTAANYASNVYLKKKKKSNVYFICYMYNLKQCISCSATAVAMLAEHIMRFSLLGNMVDLSYCLKTPI